MDLRISVALTFITNFYIVKLIIEHEFLLIYLSTPDFNRAKIKKTSKERQFSPWMSYENPYLDFFRIPILRPTSFGSDCP